MSEIELYRINAANCRWILRRRDGISDEYAAQVERALEMSLTKLRSLLLFIGDDNERAELEAFINKEG